MPNLLLLFSSRLTLRVGLIQAVIITSISLFATLLLVLAFSSLALLVFAIILASLTFALLACLAYNLIVGH
jgi:hypothetical protein